MEDWSRDGGGGRVKKGATDRLVFSSFFLYKGGGDKEGETGPFLFLSFSFYIFLFLYRPLYISPAVMKSPDIHL